ncbi:MAG: hypothetical protein ABSC32_16685 [Steroidobacteraceae bacterium]|jgi:hypothetical protein
MFDSPSAEPGIPAKLKRDKNFQPCPAKSGDEHYQNGIFEFNVTRLLAFIDTCADRFPIELVPVAEFPDYGGSDLDEETVRPADLSRPILLAEIAPELFNVIDGNHRLARARRERVQAVPSRTVRCPDHVHFLTSVWAYEKYVEYWNSKLEDLPQAKASRTRRKGALPGI